MIMNQPQQASSRVAFNTLILYAKMLITVGISLYSTRLVLNALGASDYGISNLIGGVIVMLAFLNVAMTTSTQRYLSFHQGKRNFDMQKKIFSNSWILHIVIGVVVVGFLFALLPFLFGGFLNIPADRIPTAKVVYYFMSISVFFTIISVPFTASLNAHENMLWIAIVNIIESIIRLGIAFCLFWFIQTERLMVYGILTAALSVVSFSLYAVFCLKKYSECCVINCKLDKPLLKELGTFSGWTLIGAFSALLSIEGIAIILNIFFGTVVNAAYGIANQVAGQLNFFSQTMLRAINPQIMKSEGMNDRARMLRLSMMACKFSFFLLAFIAIPFIFEMPAILKFWLKDVPDYAIAFCLLILISSLIGQLTIGLQSAFQASGKIRVYQSVVGGTRLFVLPVAYSLLKIGYAAYYAIIVMVVTDLFLTVFRIVLLKINVGLSINEYFKRVIYKCISPVVASSLVCWTSITLLDDEWYRFIITTVLSILSFFIAIYFCGLCTDEKTMVHSILNKIIEKWIRKK